MVPINSLCMNITSLRNSRLGRKRLSYKFGLHLQKVSGLPCGKISKAIPMI